MRNRIRAGQFFTKVPFVIRRLGSPFSVARGSLGDNTFDAGRNAALRMGACSLAIHSLSRSSVGLATGIEPAIF
jgi:hypothetical protein